MLEAYRAHVQERAELGIPPKPLDPEWTAELVELLKAPPAGEEAFLLDLIANRVPPGVDEAAYVKAGFLSAIVTGEASSPLIDAAAAVKLLGNMHGGYNVATLVNLLDDDALAESAAEELKGTILVFDAFHDVAAKADAGNAHAKAVMQSWADAEWFSTNDAVYQSIKCVVFKVTGETNTDDLSPAQDAWSRPDIPLHARAMYKMQRDGLSPEVQGEVGPMAQIKEAARAWYAGGLCRRCGRYRFVTQICNELGSVVLWRGHAGRTEQAFRRHMHRQQGGAHFLQHHGRCGCIGI